MMARKYVAPKCDYTIDGNRVVSQGDIRGRVSGTMMAGILGISPWSTPFQVACNLLGLCSEDIGDKPAVKAGRMLESRIIDYVGETYSDRGLFIPAETVYEKREGDHDSWVSDFDDDVFAGHVDGIVMSPEGENFILEIKTSSNYDAWAEGVPEYYYWQVALYNEFITQKDRAYIVLGMVDQETYRAPEAWTPTDTNVVMFEQPIDREKVQETLLRVREWYEEYIAKGITPPYDPTNIGDAAMFEHLTNLTTEEGTMSELVDRYSELDAAIKEGENALKDKVQARDALKDRIKSYLDCHSLAELQSASGDCYATISVRYSSSIDKEKLMKAGIDPTPFTTTTTTKTFSVKKNKKV